MILRILLLSSLGVGLVAVVAARAVALQEDARQALCLSRMRELAIAVRHYAADHEDALPLVADRTRKPWTWWYHRLFAYTPSIATFYCPVVVEAHPVPPRSRLLPPVWNLECLSYGMTHFLDALQRKGRMLRLGEVTDPQKKFLFGESHHVILRPTPLFWDKDVAPRHEGHANFVTFGGEGVHFGDLPGAVPSRSGTGVHDLANWTLP